MLDIRHFVRSLGQGHWLACDQCREKDRVRRAERYATRSPDQIRLDKAYRDGRKAQTAQRKKAQRLSLPARARQLWHNANARAKKRGVPCSITPEWVLERLERGYCEATGEAFVLTSAIHPAAPSIDRIGIGGYTPENSRVTTTHFNVARSQFGDERLLELALLIVDANTPTGAKLAKSSIPAPALPTQTPPGTPKADSAPRKAAPSKKPALNTRTSNAGPSHAAIMNLGKGSASVIAPAKGSRKRGKGGI